MKKLLLFISLLTSSSTIHAQHTWKRMTTNDGLSSDTVSAVYAETATKTIAACGQNLHIIENGVITSTLTDPDAPSQKKIDRIFKDSQGRYWVSYEFSGEKSLFTGNNIQHINPPNGTGNYSVKGFAELNNEVLMSFQSSSGNYTIYKFVNGQLQPANFGINGTISPSETSDKIYILNRTNDKIFEYDGANTIDISNGEISLLHWNFVNSEGKLVVKFKEGTNDSKVKFYHNQQWHDLPTQTKNDVYSFHPQIGFISTYGSLYDNQNSIEVTQLDLAKQYYNHTNGLETTLDIKTISNIGSTIVFGTQQGLYYSEEGLPEIPSEAFLYTGDLKVPVSSIGSFGNLWKDESNMIVKTNTGQSVMSFNSLWIGAVDISGSIKFVGNNYGNDFTPGPILNENEDLSSGRVWKISKQEIDQHINSYSNSGYVIPEAILSWPAHGNTSLGNATCLAPFKDLNQDGIYSPEQGEYPLIRGDEAIYSIYNDNYWNHHASKGEKLGIEIHQMTFIVNTIENVFFSTYRVINRSDSDLQDVYIGQLVDGDIGTPFDDYAGSIPTSNAFYYYNSDDLDDTTSNYVGFGHQLRANGIQFLDQNLSAFMSYNSSESIFTKQFPSTVSQNYNAMRAIWKDGSNLNYGGNGVLDAGNPNPTSFMFDGNPFNGTGWTESSSGLLGADKTGLGTIGPLTINSQEELIFSMAFSLGDESNTAAGSVGHLYNKFDEIQNWWNANSANLNAMSTACTEVSVSTDDLDETQPEVQAFPNPTSGLVQFKGLQEGAQYKLSSIDGRLLQSGVVNSSLFSLSIKAYPKGIYFIEFEQDQSTRLKLIKE